jgi:hypothetical protein
VPKCQGARVLKSAMVPKCKVRHGYVAPWHVGTSEHFGTWHFATLIGV